MPSVLIVDDLLSIHEMLDAVIQPSGFVTSFATDGEKALARYKTEKFDLVLADIDMKPMDGITLLKQLKLYDPSAVIIIMTAYASTDSAIQALKFGAFDYLQKPFRVDELIATLKRGLEFRRFQTERLNNPIAPGAQAVDVEGRLIGQSPKIKKLVQQVKKLATVRTPVLLQGEPGTGKIDVAELLHQAGSEPNAQLVRIDCSLSSETNVRSGLLGQNGAGGTWVEQARGGTLFLQHLQCLTLEVQKELVSVLRNNAHTFRLICTSTVDLEGLTDEGKFHDELFYRVASLPVQMPALRERREDVPLLVKHYAAQALNPQVDAKLINFTEDALAVMQAYHWAGNLTELHQVVTRIASTAESRVVTSEQLPLRLRELKSWPTLADYLAGQERRYTDMVLHVCHGDKVAAAKALGVDVAKLG
ncbi:sigma-54 dependent transcriptional regulator [Horticoccus luteus]|uniref:Sigma-54 dependent transcriptional regulator n=1 Tax=Horticoccus luteus TaxID=2862869 RepID=A0A8F9TUN8_9BACT|nr:sigma-54 dependent transcriptional regulator [Horticoccus luteus]QYM78108.1 sigma-54 dependent transcriptional regulator [Horticoccus luteus]